MCACISELCLLRKAGVKRTHTFGSYCVQDLTTNQTSSEHTAELSEPASDLQFQHCTSLNYTTFTNKAESQSILLGVGTACGNLWSNLQKNTVLVCNSFQTLLFH